MYLIYILTIYHDQVSLSAISRLYYWFQLFRFHGMVLHLYSFAYTATSVFQQIIFKSPSLGLMQAFYNRNQEIDKNPGSQSLKYTATERGCSLSRNKKKSWYYARLIKKTAIQA